MLRRDAFELPFALVLGFLLLPSGLRACQCIDRGPTCSWFAGFDGRVFVGRVAESVPGPWADFEVRRAALAESLGHPNPEDFDPERLEGDALRAFISLFRDYLNGAIGSQADLALAAVSSAEDLERWQDEYGEELLDRRRVRFEVAEVFLGNVDSTFELHAGLGSPGDCSPAFRVGEDYLVFAHGQDGDWSTSGCAGTRLTEFAEADLEYLRGYQESPDTVRILGTFYRHDFDGTTRRYSTEPISGADIVVRSGKEIWTTTTHLDGFFEIPELLPGQYEVSGDYRGWEVIESSSWRTRTLKPVPIALNVPTGACGSIDLLAYRARGQISGRLLDHQNRPLRDAAVDLESATGQYLTQLTQTDSQGRFEFDRLEPTWLG